MDSTKAQTRILIADDHPIFRDGLKRLLEAERGFRVIGEACDGVEAVSLVHQLKPEILLLDLAMPRRPGLEALRELSTQSLSARVILLTAAVEKEQIVEALQLGARSCAERLRNPDFIEGDSRRDEWRILGRPRKRFQPRAIFAGAG